MSSSRWTHSIQGPSIFTNVESSVSVNTQWTAETSNKFDAEVNVLDVHLDTQHALNEQVDLSSKKWTCARLRKLVKLYLLTDLTLDGIINYLRTEDFQPCKRSVQDKLRLLLQPQPRTIRPKCNAGVLRKLLVECTQLQRARRIRKQQRRRRSAQRCFSEQESALRKPHEYRGGLIARKFIYNGTSSDPTSLNLLGQGGSLSDTTWFETIAAMPWEHRDLNGNLSATRDCPIGFQLPTAYAGNPVSNIADLSCKWHLEDFGVQSQPLGLISTVTDPNATYPSKASPSMQDYDDDFFTSMPTIGFDSDFGLPSFYPPDFLQMMAITETEDQAQIGQFSVESTAPELLSGRYPLVDPIYAGDFSETASSFRSTATSCYDLDPVIIPAVGEVTGHPKLVDKATSSGSEDKISLSKISSMLSKMSLTPPSTASSASGKGTMSSMFSCPIILPGVFPEYCWEHLSHNTLRRCGAANEPQKCNSRHLSRHKQTHRSLRGDILSNILHLNVQPADIHEVDTFGNSTLHILATILAPPSYLIHLIELGADVNCLNSAGQTFLHLVKPELLHQCEDFCGLLEVLSDKHFKFFQLDHLGQSPLHILMRPWMDKEALRKVILKLNNLQIHNQLSTARDVLGYTVVGELNFQETSSFWEDMDEAIFSLACETEPAIANPQDPEVAAEEACDKNSPTESEQLDRNYENHPVINTVEDLVKYEQHIDYWRTIIAAKESPWFEDSYGRNALHCLAEASLASPDDPLPDRLQAHYKSLIMLGCVNGKNERVCLVDFFLSVGVDPNNYDKSGNTPLMAFILYRLPTESEDTLTQILDSLLKAGSTICRRNREGETALHLAVKLGCRAATEALLAAGANVHVRTTSGLGVLELGQKHASSSRQDGELYAQIMLCLTLSASFGALSKPTILDEWGSRWQIPNDSRLKKKGFSKIKNLIIKKARGRGVASS